MPNGHAKKKSPDENFEFLTLGGNPIFDLCNTVAIHRDHSEDRLKTVGLAEAFFKEFFQQDISLSENQFAGLLNLRQCLRSYFSSIHNKKENTTAASNLAHSLSKITLTIDWNPKDGAFSRLTVFDNDKKHLQPLISEFFKFSQNSTTERMKKCANESCSHLFYDSSKNNTRVWCSMKSCGNIMKARSFQARMKTK